MQLDMCMPHPKLCVKKYLNSKWSCRRHLRASGLAAETLCKCATAHVFNVPLLLEVSDKDAW